MHFCCFKIKCAKTYETCSSKCTSDDCIHLFTVELTFKHVFTFSANKIRENKYVYCTTNSMATEYGLTAWRARNVVMYDIQFLGAWCVCETYARLTAFKQHQVRR